MSDISHVVSRYVPWWCHIISNQEPWYSWCCRIWYLILIVIYINLLRKLIWYRYDISDLYRVNTSTFLISNAMIRSVVVPVCGRWCISHPTRTLNTRSTKNCWSAWVVLAPGIRVCPISRLHSTSLEIYFKYKRNLTYFERWGATFRIVMSLIFLQRNQKTEQII